MVYMYGVATRIGSDGSNAYQIALNVHIKLEGVTELALERRFSQFCRDSPHVQGTKLAAFFTISKSFAFTNKDDDLIIKEKLCLNK